MEYVTSWLENACGAAKLEPRDGAAFCSVDTPSFLPTYCLYLCGDPFVNPRRGLHTSYTTRFAYIYYTSWSGIASGARHSVVPRPIEHTLPELCRFRHLALDLAVLALYSAFLGGLFALTFGLAFGGRRRPGATLARLAVDGGAGLLHRLC